MKFVLDASVAVKWVLPEIDTPTPPRCETIFASLFMN